MLTRFRTWTRRYFYTEVLGLKLLPRPEMPFAGAWLADETGRVEIHLFVSDALKPGAGTKPSNLARHAAYTVDDVVVTDISKAADAAPPEDREAGWKGLESVVEEIEALGRRSVGLYSDVSDADQVADMVGQTIDRFGKIDIFVANAGSRPGRDRR